MEKYEYFRKSVIITGKHSRLVDDMWVQGQIQESYFKRLVDLYTIAAVIGLRTQKSVPEDKTEDGKRTVQVDQLTTNYEELDTIMQMILLLDETSHLSDEEKINRAFKGPRTKEEFDANVDLFNSYVRGGIEVLHTCLVQRALGIDDDYTDVKVGNIMALFENALLPEVK